MIFNAATIEMLQEGIWETLYMVVLSSAISYLIGIPLGIILVVTDKDGIRPIPILQSILGVAINLLRAIPFIILLIMVLPLTQLLVGTVVGSKAIVPPLVIAAAPYIARMVESSFKEVDAGVIEAAKSMGASTFQIVWKVLLPEAKPSLLVGAAISITTILGYSAMAGFVGGGGLGAIAINHGYYRYEVGLMLVTAAILVIIVQIIQEVMMRLSKATDRRIR
ncbi:MAG TPA: ABC transporter permease [Candidatus Lachnoclostridium avicola]|nr:ABC transporter permease [Candidatus Lachnoclostridium avicola]